MMPLQYQCRLAQSGLSNDHQAELKSFLHSFPIHLPSHTAWSQLLSHDMICHHLYTWSQQLSSLLQMVTTIVMTQLIIKNFTIHTTRSQLPSHNNKNQIKQLFPDKKVCNSILSPGLGGDQIQRYLLAEIFSSP